MKLTSMPTSVLIYSFLSCQCRLNNFLRTISHPLSLLKRLLCNVSFFLCTPGYCQQTLCTHFSLQRTKNYRKPSLNPHIPSHPHDPISVSSPQNALNELSKPAVSAYLVFCLYHSTKTALVKVT